MSIIQFFVFFFCFCYVPFIWLRKRDEMSGEQKVVATQSKFDIEDAEDDSYAHVHCSFACSLYACVNDSESPVAIPSSSSDVQALTDRLLTSLYRVFN